MDPHVIVLFGATGALARRKLWPGMFHLYKAGLLPDEFCIIGSGRHEPDDFAGLVAKAIGEDPGDFAQRISFVSSSPDDGTELKQAIDDALPGARKLLYMSIPPSAMQPMVGMLGRDG